MDTNERSFGGGWPGHDWIDENLWRHGIVTDGVSPRLDKPMWSCDICYKRQERWQITYDLKGPIEHLKSVEHEQNMLLSKLAQEEE